MELILLNTSNPFIILLYTLIIVGVILVSKSTKSTALLIALIVAVIGLLIFHSVTLENLQKDSSLISNTYHCIAADLILLLLTFISYLWIDSIRAKAKNIKSYDDSLNWFWNKV